MKITNAMYMISSSKMQKAKKKLEDTEPFFRSQQQAVTRFMAVIPKTMNIYFDKDILPEKRKRGYVVITADKGLAGAYNHNVLKLAESEIRSHPHSKLFVVGELGRQFFQRKGFEPDGEFAYTVQDPTMFRARHIQQKILEMYTDGELDEVYIIYTHMVNSFQMDATSFKLLPLNKEEYRVKTDSNGRKYEDITFFPSVEAVLDNLIPNVVSGYIYGALVHSYVSEHNSRMMAMQTATDSAKKMLHELGMEYNRVRQAAITQEITEVIAGAKAQKSRKK